MTTTPTSSTKSPLPDSMETEYKRLQTRIRNANIDSTGRLVLEGTEIIDFSSSSSSSSSSSYIQRVPPPPDSSSYCTGDIYTVSEYDGFYFFPHAVSTSLQYELAYQAVTEFCEVPPHRTNLSTKNPNDTSSLWDLWKQSNGFTTATTATSTTTSTATSTHAKQQKTNTNTKDSFQKLSWSTMGYHYDWTHRTYHKHDKSYIPTSLQQLSKQFATLTHLLNTAKTTTTTTTTSAKNNPYVPSACIVNYYTSKRSSFMGGHRDDLEQAIHQPIISISLGLDAIFLLGGTTKDHIPVIPILVRSGDVLVLSHTCRLNYHGVAKILPRSFSSSSSSSSSSCSSLSTFQSNSPSNCTLPPMDNNNDRYISQATIQKERPALDSFLNQYRININVRQVYNDDEEDDGGE